MIERRDFFDPSLLEEPADPADPVLLRFGRRAMATTFEVILPFGTNDAHAAAENALDEIDRLESQMTVYRDDSEMSRINAEALARAVPVEPELFELLQQCRRWYDETRGGFDIAVGVLIKAWGFFRRQGKVPDEDERRRAMSRSGMRLVRLDAQQRTIRFVGNGVELNLGSVGKGYAIDRAAASLTGAGIRSALLHGGHSSIFAMGSEPNRERGWSVGVMHPDRPESRLGVMHLRNRGMAISARTHQHFLHEGRKLGHLLDPRTGWPAEGIATVAVTAPTAAEADALATAFFVLGEDFARGYCDTHPHIGALLLAEGTAPPSVLGHARREFVAG
ncbi:MAG: FAD:protein FMN transferase [Gemmataceae bacterium]